MVDENKGYLAGQVLLAMPGMGDTRFNRAVIYICAHDKNGAMGLVINHIVPGLKFGSLLKELNVATDITIPSDIVTLPVINGGPVETARGFLLHSKDFKHDDTVDINESFSLTGTVDALKEVASGQGPKDMVFTLGYAGWSAGQLDQELHQNAWLTCEASRDLIFDTAPHDMWDAAVGHIGVDPSLLSLNSGHA
ncbi:MAG: YqgE/AlgH family protein [Pseudomonadota bacterium]